MQAGQLLAERFVIEALLATGGMGEILRARDLVSGQAVAVKVMRGGQRSGLGALESRFAREASILQRLRHPGIVRHIAHGSESDETWIAMAWLEGEDLEHRLARAPLSLGETLALTRALAEALAFAHKAGVIHRDLKPSNIFLVGREAGRPNLIDFGIAREEGGSSELTRTGAVLGTIGYMAPEQASGESLDARCDLFALGCILFECLTGRPAFAGATPMAVLAKLLVSDPEPLSLSRPDLPVPLTSLCDRLLMRDRDERPASADAVLAMLAETTVGAPSELHSSAPRAPTVRERRVHSVVIAELWNAAASEGRTMTPADVETAFAPLREAANAYGGVVATLGPTAIALSIEGHGSARDQAEQAAHAAILTAESPFEMRLAIATGHAETSASGATGPVIDRAFSLLGAQDVGWAIAIDEATRGLLGAGFETRSVNEKTLLIGRTPKTPRVHRLLGKPVPCVGRERELSQLEATVLESASESVARSMLISAAPGTGKSRLLFEALARLEKSAPELAVFSARAEVVRKRSPLGLIRQLLRSASGAGDGEATDAELTRHLRELSLAETPHADFLRDLLGLPQARQPDELHNDLLGLREGTKRAFEAYVAARARSGPVLLAVEDLHWADAASVGLLVSTLRRGAELPLALIATSRPEIAVTFPDFARDTAATELRLSGLTRRAAEKIARLALGVDATDAAVSRAVDLCDGNAFYLEELVRTARAQEQGALPPSVVAMAQVRLMRLDGEARQVLRAASIFGESFTTESVTALLASDSAGDSWQPGHSARGVAERRLPELRAEEVLTEEASGRWAFRHALLRSAAYAMLTNEGQKLGHRLAAEYLISVGEQDPNVLAEHFSLAGDNAHAAHWLVRAARAALEAGTTTESEALVVRAISLGAEGEDLGHLLSSRAFARTMVGDFAAAIEAASAAMLLLPKGTTAWFRAAATAVFGDANSGRMDSSIPVMQTLLGLTTTPDPTAPYARTVAILAATLVITGQLSAAERLLEGLQRASGPRQEKLFTIFAKTAESLIALSGRDDIAGALREGRAACAMLDGVIDPMALVMPLSSAARVLAECGRYADAIRLTDRAAEAASRARAPYLQQWAVIVRSMARIRAGISEGVVDDTLTLESSPSALMRTMGTLNRAWLATLQGRLTEAAALLRSAGETAAFPALSVDVCTLNARIAFLNGDLETCLLEVERGFRAKGTLGGLIHDTSWLHRMRAEALLGLGRVAEAKLALELGTARLRALSGPLAPEDREAFLAIEPVARVLQLATELGLS